MFELNIVQYNRKISHIIVFVMADTAFPADVMWFYKLRLSNIWRLKFPIYTTTINKDIKNEFSLFYLQRLSEDICTSFVFRLKRLLRATIRRRSLHPFCHSPTPSPEPAALAGRIVLSWGRSSIATQWISQRCTITQCVVARRAISVLRSGA